jgi:PleD family two-component response regulator
MRSPEDLIAAADAALYQAKRAGRDSVRIHQAMQASA